MNTKITITIEADCEDDFDAENVATTMATNGRQGLREGRKTENCKVKVEYTKAKTFSI